MQSQTLSHQNLTRALQAAGRGVRPGELETCAYLMAWAFHDDPAIRYLLGGTDLGPEDWRYFYTVLRAVYGKCVLLSTDDRLENLLILFPPRLKSVPALAFFRRGGGKLWRHFGLGLYVRSLRYEAHCGRVREKCVPPEAWHCMRLVASPEVQGRGFRQADVSAIPGMRIDQYAMLKPGTPELGAKNGAHPAGWLRPPRL